MSSSTRVILGLVAGLAGGALLGALNDPALARLIAFIEPVGMLWLNALRMTVVPLVVAMLITGIASAAESAASGRLAARVLLLFVIFLTGAALLAAVLTPAALALWPVPADAAATVRAGLGHAAAAVPTLPPFGDWLTQVVPANPFAALSEGAMLPLVVFALLFGFAASRIEVSLRVILLGFFQAVVETMLVLIRWVLWAAPAGVFALALGVGYRSGVGAAGALGFYLVLMCSLGVLITIALYPIAAIMGGASFSRFARAAAPAQVVAVSTQSSLASLPAMIAGAQSDLAVPARIASITLPLAVSLFRISSPPFNLSIVLFVAHVYGVHIGALQLAAGIAVAVVTSLGVVGLPSQITFFTTTVPISLAMGVPTEMLSLLLALEVIPDIFRTVGNVTADLALTAIVARWFTRQPRAGG
jgi:Na+/H+-dicarboxylate symporter